MDTSNEKPVHKTIADWIGDVVALEGHIEEVMDHQLDIDTPTVELKQAFQTFHDTVKASKDRAVQYQSQYGSTAGNPLIKTGAELLGKAAGIIDKLRDDTAAKALRDDYTAYNHVAIAYTMLHTTAKALDDSATATFAEQGMRTYAGMIQDINQLMPVAVIEDLKANDEVPALDHTVVEECRRTIDNVWTSTKH